MAIGRDWRDQVREDALDPDLPIIDAHHHIWNEAPVPIVEAYPAEMLFEDKANSGHNVIATVEVDCLAHYRTNGPERFRVIGETEYVDRVADEAEQLGGRYAGACAAIVPNANLLEGASVGEVLDAHIEASSRVRGIRHMTASEPSLPPSASHGRPQGILSEPKFREGFAELSKRNLVFDAWIFQTQLAELTKLARAFPNTPIVLDMLGGPFIGGRYEGDRAASFAEWRQGIALISRCENVVVKLGGLNMPSAGVDAAEASKPRTSEETAAAHRHYITAAIDAFSPSRAMFVSNFPVEMRGISYGLLWNSFKRMTAGYSETERHEMFSGVAARTYRIAV